MRTASLFGIDKLDLESLWLRLSENERVCVENFVCLDGFGSWV